MLTHQDALARLLIPAVEALNPPEAMEARQRTAYALTREGKVNHHALMLAGALVIDLYAQSTTDTNTTTTYDSYITKTYTLPSDGSWTVLTLGAVTGFLSASAEFQVRVKLNGINSGDYSIPTGASAERLTVFASNSQTSIPGGSSVPVIVQYRTSSGAVTANAEGGFLVFVAYRES